MQPYVAWLVPLLFLTVFPLIWAAICFLLAALSGWRGLARRYRGRLAQPEASASMVSGGMGLISYRGVLDVRVSGEGLGLSVLPIFVGAPPLAIPWADVTVFPRDRMLWMDRQRLQIDGTDLTLYGAGARLVDEFCTRRFPQPETPALST